MRLLQQLLIAATMGAVSSCTVGFSDVDDDGGPPPPDLCSSDWVDGCAALDMNACTDETRCAWIDGGRYVGDGCWEGSGFCMFAHQGVITLSPVVIESPDGTCWAVGSGTIPCGWTASDHDCPRTDTTCADID